MIKIILKYLWWYGKNLITDQTSSAMQQLQSMYDKAGSIDESSKVKMSKQKPSESGSSGKFVIVELNSFRITRMRRINLYKSTGSMYKEGPKYVAIGNV